MEWPKTLASGHSHIAPSSTRESELFVCLCSGSSMLRVGASPLARLSLARAWGHTRDNCGRNGEHSDDGGEDLVG